MPSLGGLLVVGDWSLSSLGYAHLSLAFLSAEVSLLDPPKPPPPTPEKGKESKRTREGRSDASISSSRSAVPDFVKELGSVH